MTDGQLAGNVLLFGRMLRAAGLDVHGGRMIDAVRAMEWVGVTDRRDVRAALRSVVVCRHEDIPVFDEAFDLFFRAHEQAAPGLPLFSLGERPRIVARARPGVAVPAELEAVRPESGGVTRAVGAWSREGVSRTKDFAALNDAELERARQILERLAWDFARRRTRRWGRAEEGGVDLRRALREGVRRGDLVDLPRRRRLETSRPLVLIADVSGSMERYSRVMLHFAYGLMHSGGRADVFVFATRLTRVSRTLMQTRGRRVLDALARDVQDWGGGTRIGDALRTFNTRWARRVMRHGPIVIMISDGWDRGDPGILDRELARVRRSGRRLIWLNPLLGSASYEPLTRGMQVALRHIDDFLPVHNLASIEQLVAHLREVH